MIGATSGSSRCICWPPCSTPTSRLFGLSSTQLGVDPAQIKKAAEQGLTVLPKVSGGETTISPELVQVFETAQTEAERMKDQYVSVEHLLLALLKTKSRAKTLLEALGIGEQDGAAGVAEGSRRPASHRPDPRR